MESEPNLKVILVWRHHQLIYEKIFWEQGEFPWCMNLFRLLFCILFNCRIFTGIIYFQTALQL